MKMKRKQFFLGVIMLLAIITLVGCGGLQEGEQTAAPTNATTATPSPSVPTVTPSIEPSIEPSPSNTPVVGGMVSVPAGSIPYWGVSVSITAFSISQYEVTQLQYETITGTNPSAIKVGVYTQNKPVDSVTWIDAVTYCNLRSTNESLEQVYTINGATVTADFSKSGYRLPTEAEWEYAARGAVNNFYAYSGSNTASDVAWYGTTEIKDVGGKAANELGLKDMSGNAREWCWDWYGAYPLSNQSDYNGPASGTERVVRGGGFRSPMSDCTVGTRQSNSPTAFGIDGGGYNYGTYTGFRVVRR